MIDAKEISDLLPQIKAAEKELLLAEEHLAVLMMKRGQECAHIHIAGKPIPLTQMTRESAGDVP